ncbi:MAG: biotin/lipoyl-containing protein [Lachnospirales bacterium]
MKKIYKIKVNDRIFEVELEEVKEVEGNIENANILKENDRNNESKSNGYVVNAPMPGNIFEIKVESGQKVNKGDILIVLESMKMESEILAEKSGIIGNVFIEKGMQVVLGDKLLIIE